MVSGRNPAMDREAMLRRVAIVLSNLPAPMAAKLLGSIDADAHQAVRRTMSTLADVDPLEQRRALQAFKGIVAQQASCTNLVSADGDALQIQSEGTSTRVENASRVLPANFARPRQRPIRDAIPATASALEQRTASPDKWISRDETDGEPWTLASLDGIDHVRLARILRSEHPQTIALVLASISPEQAARVLPRFEPELRQETISRIGRLGEVPSAALSEVAEHFRHRLQADQSPEQPSLGRQALNAILAAMPKQQPMDADTRHDSFVNSNSGNPAEDSSAADPSYQLIERLRQAERAWQHAHQRQPMRHDANRSLPERADRNLPERIEQSMRTLAPRRTRESSPLASRLMQSRALTEDSLSDEVVTSHASPIHELNTNIDSPRAFPTAEAVHARLIELKPIELCQALGMVDARDAMLTLCGLPVPVSEAALAMLPRVQAKQTRAKMNSLGSVQLREIDRAKASVAVASLTLADSPALSTARAA